MPRLRTTVLRTGALLRRRRRHHAGGRIQMCRLPALRHHVSDARPQNCKDGKHLPTERKLASEHHRRNLPSGDHRRRPAVEYGQPEGLPVLLGPDSSQRQPGYEPVHRPAARTDGNEGFPRQKASRSRIRFPRGADFQAAAADRAGSASHVLGHVLWSHFRKRAQIIGPGSHSLRHLLQHR